MYNQVYNTYKKEFAEMQYHLQIDSLILAGPERSPCLRWNALIFVDVVKMEEILTLKSPENYGHLSGQTLIGWSVC